MNQPHARPVALAAAMAAALLSACSTPQPPAPAAPAPAWEDQARKVAAAVPPRLLAVLTTEIARSGPEGAIASCREQAPAMARKASEETGWAIRRVSLRNRNPKAVPDAWERAVLADFDRQAAAGMPPGALERAERVTGTDGKAELRYMKALPVMEMCTACHGTPDKLSPAVVAHLKAQYPQDLGVGYRVGDIRGAITLRKPAP